MAPKNAEDFVYQAVVNGELLIDNKGQVWRVAVRKGNRWSGRTHVVPCKKRRAEHKTASYLQVRLMVSGTRVSASAHRLVWRHFNGPIPEGLTINHKNGVKTDNRPENLEAMTYAENLKHAYRMGLKDQSGQTNPAAILADTQVEVIRQTYAEGQTTQAALAERYGVTFQTISDIVRGKRRVKQGGPTGDYTHRRYSPEAPRDAKGRYRS